VFRRKRDAATSLHRGMKVGTGIYLVVIAMLSSSIGGYIAGRLRSRWIGVHSDEVYFRDTAHGFVAWAFAHGGLVGRDRVEIAHRALASA
jgi:hypothetical protein